MNARRHGPDPVPGSFEWTRSEHERNARRATPRQRLEWLEEVLELAYQAGVLPRRAVEPRSSGGTWGKPDERD